MEFILLKSSFCLLAFIAFYKVFLERTSKHQFKRFYLLSVVIISIAIPFITFIEYIEPQTVINNFSEIVYFSETQELAKEPTNYLPLILWSIYGLGIVLFSLRFANNLLQIGLKIKRNTKLKNSNYIHVLLQDLVLPHTFFSYIFLNKTKFENKEIPNEVLLHEATHAKEKHSLDILFIEFLQIIFWFNPLIYVLKNNIKLNHEFLADQAVLKQGVQPAMYQQLLLEFSSHSSTNQLANAINYSLIKKRFTVMKTQTAKQTFWLRSLLILPLLAILIFSFSNKKQVEKTASTENQIILNENGVTETMMIEYQDFITEYNKTNRINYKEYNRIVAIYNLMTTEQKDLVEKYPEIPNIDLSKTIAKRPTKKQFEEYKNSKKFALWLDGKHIKNTELNNINIEDISHYTESFVHNNARSNKFPQPYQNHLYTKDGFKNTFTNYKKDKSSLTQIENELKQKTLPTINGITCDGCTVNLSKEGIEKLILSTTTNQEIKSFLFKIAGNPPIKIIGNRLNDNAKNQLKDLKKETVVQLFNIKTATNNFSPILITLVDKNVENYSHSPQIKKADDSKIPPPPTPQKTRQDLSVATSSSKSNTINEKHLITIDDISLDEDKNGYIYLPKKSNTFYYIVKNNKLTLYDRFGNIVDKKGNEILKTKQDLPIPPPIPENATPKQRKKMEVAIEEYEKWYKRRVYTVKNTKTGEVDSYIINDEEYTNEDRENAKRARRESIQKRNAQIKEEITNSNTQKSTLDHVIEMAKKDAIFYYDKKKISSDKAIKIVKENSSLTVSSTQTNSNTPIVTLYKNGYKHQEIPKPAKSAYEHVKNLKYDNISYFYNNKKISYKKALKITKLEPNINMSSHIDNGVGTVKFESVRK